jgi:hypothetical protein
MEELLRLKELLWQWFLEASDQPGFEFGVFSGLCLGVALAAALGSISFVRGWWRQVSAPYRPQTITQTFTTKDTPAQVMSRSLRAILVGFGAIMCVACVLAEMLVPGIIETMIQNLVP